MIKKTLPFVQLDAVARGIIHKPSRGSQSKSVVNADLPIDFQVP